jgi:hypothetical protein
LFDDALELCGQFIDLLRADVLARKVDVFIKRHCGMPFLFQFPRPAQSPSSPSERLECPEGGNTGRRTIGPAAGEVQNT